MSTLRQTLREIDPDLPLLQMTPYVDLMEKSPNLWIVKLGAPLFGAFARHACEADDGAPNRIRERKSEIDGWKALVCLTRNYGWGGIRTPGAFRHTRFPGVHNQPLCHPSRSSDIVIANLR